MRMLGHSFSGSGEDYTMYAASPTGRYIARCNNPYKVEIHDSANETRYVLDKVQHPYCMCFVNESSILICEDFVIHEYSSTGLYLRKCYVEHCPYSVVCDGRSIVYTSSREKTLNVHDYVSELLVHKIDVSAYFSGCFLDLTKDATILPRVFVHDSFSTKVGVVNYRTGDFIKYVHTGGDACSTGVLDFGDVFIMRKYSGEGEDRIELRDWKDCVVVLDSIPIPMTEAILAFAPKSKKLLIEKADGSIGWYTPWYFTPRAQWLRVLV